VPISDWTPTLPRVGSLLRARTKDVLGNEIGTFTPDTRPTDSEATEQILQATQDVAMVVGNELPDVVWPEALNVAALGAACLIELSYFPEQINAGPSPYNQLKDMYDDRLKRLVLLVQANGGDVVGPEPGVPMEPVASFPRGCDPYMVGWGTRW